MPDLARGFESIFRSCHPDRDANCAGDALSPDPLTASRGSPNVKRLFHRTECA